MFVLQATAFLSLPLLGAGSFAMFCGLSFVVLSCYGGAPLLLARTADTTGTTKDRGS